MIVYEGGGLGDFKVLTRIHGSAAYKAFPLAVVSTGILLCYEFFDFQGSIEEKNEAVLLHPYSINVLIAFFRYAIKIPEPVRSSASYVW